MDFPNGSPSERPTLYLDQNILGDPIECLIASDNFSIWKENIVLVFSDETIKEIIRSGGLSARFLSNLSQFYVARIYPEMNAFKQTGRFLIRYTDPREWFEYTKQENLVASKELQGLVALHKMHGGQADKSFEEIFEAQVQAFDDSIRTDLYRSMTDEKAVNSIASKIVDPLRSSLKQMNFVGEGLEIQNWLESYRNSLGLNVQRLNSIEGSKIIEQIWEFVKQTAKCDVPNSSDKFFNISGINPITGGEYTLQDKIRNVMLILNMMGYASDKKLKRENKFISSMSDLEHAVYGSLCTGIVSKDINFRKRLKATYEYLEVSCPVYDVDLSKKFELVPT